MCRPRSPGFTRFQNHLITTSSSIYCTSNWTKQFLFKINVSEIIQKLNTQISPYFKSTRSSKRYLVSDICFFVHSFIWLLMVDLKPISGTLGTRREYTLDGTLFHTNHTHTRTHNLMAELCIRSDSNNIIVYIFIFNMHICSFTKLFMYKSARNKPFKQNLKRRAWLVPTSCPLYIYLYLTCTHRDVTGSHAWG